MGIYCYILVAFGVLTDKFDAHMYFAGPTECLLGIPTDDNTLILKTGHVYSNILQSKLLYIINISSFSSNCRGIILYASTQNGNVTVSLHRNVSSSHSTTGHSAGMVQLVDFRKKHAIFYIFVNSECICSNSSEEIKIIPVELINRQPIPGGCNLIFKPNYYPLVLSKIRTFTVLLRYQLANVGFSFNQTEPNCDTDFSVNKRLIYNLYVDFFPKDSLYEIGCNSTNNCSKHITSGLMQSHMFNIFQLDLFAINVQTNIHTNKPEFVVALNPCVDVAAFITVEDPLLGSFTPYAPVIVAAKQIFYNLSLPIVVKIIFLVLLFLFGFALCFVGFRLFAFEIYAFSSIFVFLLSFIIGFMFLVPSYNVLVAFGTGIISGMLFSILWYKFGYTSYYLFFIASVGGVLFASIIFSTPLINVSFLQNRATFLPMFVAAILLYSFIFIVTSSSKSCIITSAFVGSYLMIFSLSSGYVLCSTVSLVIPLAVIRIISDEMQTAVIVNPLSTNDIIVICTWIVVFILGCLIQFRLVRGRPGLPSPSSISSSHCRSLSFQGFSNFSDSTSSRGPSFTSENYDGDISDEINGYSVDSVGGFEQTVDVLALINSS